MTAEEMKYEAEILYESIASADAPGYTNREWSYILTAGQEKVIKEIINKGLDREEKYKKAISPLLLPVLVINGVSSNITSNITETPKSLKVVIDEDTLAVTRERVTVGTSIIEVKPITQDYYNANINNPFKKPDSNYKYWRLDQLNNPDKVHIIITDLDDVDDLDKYQYIAIVKPTPIIVMDGDYTVNDGSIEGLNFSSYTATELPSTLGNFIHRWIVQEAVNIAYASDKDQLGYQISNAENVENLRK